MATRRDKLLLALAALLLAAWVATLLVLALGG